MPAAQRQHIYFLVHCSHQRFKVGTATDPLRRWAQIQPHDQTDFSESVVFDVVDPDASVKLSERAFHRELRREHLDMPRDADGHSEWFAYEALAAAHAFAQDRREFLGIGDGYTISVPPRPTVGPSGRRAGQRATWMGLFIDDPEPSNGHTAEAVEEQIEGWIRSGAVAGATESESGLRVYLDQELAPYDEARLILGGALHSALTVPNGPLMRGRRAIFGDVAATGRYIRLVVRDPFCGTQPLDSVVHPRCLEAGRSETWEETTPGAERTRTAIRRLATAVAPPFDASGIDAEIEAFWTRAVWG